MRSGWKRRAGGRPEGSRGRGHGLAVAATGDERKGRRRVAWGSDDGVEEEGRRPARGLAVVGSRTRGRGSRSRGVVDLPLAAAASQGKGEGVK
jgi:hypothetical protein